jgi:iron complex transport system substrate-binding protein
MAFAAICLLLFALLGGCKGQTVQAEIFHGANCTSSMTRKFATQFSVDYYEGGYKLITLADESRFLVVPEGGALPRGLAEDIVPLYQPIQNVYLAATSAMCLFDSLSRLDCIQFSGTREDGWYIEHAREAMRNGQILYAGKYSAPDYELILSGNCSLAIESMMIGHASSVQEKLTQLGIPVLMDQSSNEPHPLGRTEWIKLYAALLNEEDRAEEIFSAQEAFLEDTIQSGRTGKTVAFFYISSAGKAVVRKSEDYVSRMIDLAGGDYVFRDLTSDKKTSTMALEMETFYLNARDADVIIYNATIDGELTTLQELLEKSELFQDFKAVREDNVWCTAQNTYQQTTSLGQMIESFHKAFADDSHEIESLPFLYRLK